MELPSPQAVLVLAAGQGTRMKSATPKVLHELAGRSLLGHAIVAATSLAPERLAVVVRHSRDEVVAHLAEIAPQALIADQDDVPGTGRAVQCALPVLDAAVQAEQVAGGPDPAARDAQLTGEILVLSSDAPLLTGDVLAALLAAHRAGGNAVTVLTADVPDSTGYGRIVRDDATGDVIAIVEERDATEAQRAITEINSSVYVFDADVLRAALLDVQADNDQREVYLTDVIALARAQGRRVQAYNCGDPWAVEGVNDRRQLATLAAEYNRRLLDAAMLAGVTVLDPATTWLEADVRLESDVTLLPGTMLHGHTVVESGAVIGPDTTLRDCTVRRGAQVIRSQATSADIGPTATVGPFSYLRPGTVLGARGKIGAFVESKNAVIGDGSKVPHLSYIGDATVGEESNIGAATIFANYDGVTKHRSEVGSFVRVGSDNTLVAPIRIGDGAYTGAGSVIRGDVPPGALAVNAPPQRNVEGWVLRRRPGTAAAKAAEAAGAAAPPQPSSSETAREGESK